ncbi:alpha-ketoglutarate-dependent dioxygenase AlkB family protein [Stappia indica]|uniref:Alkylated DNA repair protein (DNA oxidative demethylase) n=1 Tax=Stappia indica TaxID=538381 RepID=A0A285T3R6_9HYPH|nr:alpha-ketoglutarate-dependent dioxygenase AlkB [Stappia indica]SOC13951.1 alkylated DNA repair protein (DNA oxidative demethylase) [Stappia indica]
MQDDQSQRTGSRSAASPPAGFRLLPGRFDRAMQQALLEEIRAVVAAAPLFTPVMPRTGTPFSVRMTNCGPLGWVSDRTGYRYQPEHPVTGQPWPAMPQRLLDLWQELAPDAPPPEACLVNFYAPKARMGLHQDKDEATFEAPVVSVSLGATALFRLGGRSRKDPTRSFRLASGDVLVLGGEARLAHHGVDRLLPGTSTLVRDDGRINLTLRRVTPG